MATTQQCAEFQTADYGMVRMYINRAGMQLYHPLMPDNLEFNWKQFYDWTLEILVNAAEYTRQQGLPESLTRALNAMFEKFRPTGWANNHGIVAVLPVSNEEKHPRIISYFDNGVHVVSIGPFKVSFDVFLNTILLRCMGINPYPPTTPANADCVNEFMCKLFMLYHPTNWRPRH